MAKEITGNESAHGYGFTTADGSSHVDEPGLTIRQHFAAMAMQGICANSHDNMPKEFTAIAEHAVKYADALIAELNKTP